MTDTLTVTGVVATAPNHIVTSAGLPITSFRLASTQRRYDRAQQKWVDGESNFYTVTCFRQLAHNVAGSVGVGQRIVVTGRLRVRGWKTDDKSGTNVEIDADALGHDLAWGTTVYTRSVSTAVSESEASDRPAVLEAAGEDGPEGADLSSSRTDDVGSLPVEAAVPF